MAALGKAAEKAPEPDPAEQIVVPKSVKKEIKAKFRERPEKLETDGKFSTMFDRVRVCTLCFRIYKELESYYFKELRRNISGSQMENESIDDGNETERLMNREVKNDKDDADPRMRVDKALNRIFGQVKKNMEKQHDVRSISVGAKQASANKEMFRTIDTKSSQKLQGGAGADRKGGDVGSTKLPPIAKKPT